MPFTVNVTDITPVITATSTISSFTITETNQSFNITTLQPAITITNVVSTIEFNSDGGTGFDFVTKNVGDWVSGGTYSRNDVVRYDYSIYIADSAFTATFVSTVAPPLDPTHWEPFWTTDWTFPKLRTSALKVGQMNYAATTATAGYVLAAADFTTTHWVSLGSLVFWDLSDDLRTNGFNIVTGSSINDPNPQLTIASGGKGYGNSTSTFKSYIKLFSVPTASSVGNIEIKGHTTFTNAINVLGGIFANSGSFNNGFLSDARLTRATITGTTVSIHPGTWLEGKDFFPGAQPTFIKVRKGFEFEDGTTISSAAGFIGTGTGNLQAGPGIKITTSTNTLTVSLLTATNSTIGGVRIADNNTASFRIDNSTGFLGLNTATSARVGGVKIGYGIYIDSDGVISVNTGGIATFLVSGNQGIKVENSATTTITLQTATTTAIGGIIVGQGLAIDGNGKLSSNIISGNPGIQVSSATNTITLQTATTATIGGIVVGPGLTIDSNGKLAVTTSNILLTNLSLAGEMATNGYGIKSRFTPNNYMEYTRLLLEDTSYELGWRLTGPEYTNTFRGIQHNSQGAHFTHLSNGLHISSTGTYLESNYGGIKQKVDVATDSVTITSNQYYQPQGNWTATMALNVTEAKLQYNPDSFVRATVNDLDIGSKQKISLLSRTHTLVGADIYHSELQVSKIYNYSGTGPPFFPEGVQYPDNTVQVTAYAADNGIIP